jgi:hypothetical protein
MCTTLDPDLDITEHEQAPGVAWGKAGKYAGVAWGQLSEETQESEDTEEDTEEADAPR